jgi:hypothetical protein
LTASASGYLDSHRRFYLLPYSTFKIQIPIVGELKKGELAVVLSWFEGKKKLDNTIQVSQLELNA